MAIGIVLFVSLTFGIVDAGRLIFAYNLVSAGAREGVRWAAVRGAVSGRTATADDVTSYVRSVAVGTPVNVTTTWAPDNQPGSSVAVTVQTDFAPIAPFPGVPRDLNLSSTSTMVISR